MSPNVDDLKIVLPKMKNNMLNIIITQFYCQVNINFRRKVRIAASCVPMLAITIMINKKTLIQRTPNLLHSLAVLDNIETAIWDLL